VAHTVTAIEMAKGAGIDPKAFRLALRAAKLHWHTHNDRWIVDRDSPRHSDMKAVLADLIRRSPNAHRT